MIVSHQLPIWMVHRAPRRAVAVARPATAALRAVEHHDASSAAATGFVEVGYTDPAAGLAAQATDVGAV